MRLGDLNSLGRRTDLIFARFSGEVVERADYIAVKTPSNPTYHWGNYLIFDRAPLPGDLKAWSAIFEREFDYLPEGHHLAFTWDALDAGQGEVEEFLAAGYELDSAYVLATGEVKTPPKVNAEVAVRKIESDADWEAVIRNGVLCSDPKYFSSEAKCEEFQRSRMQEYRRMSEAGLGHWFGAYLGDQLVGDLGIYHDGEIGRYQNVGTHPEHRRKGVCGTLVYETANLAFAEYGVTKLVMEADTEYHAAKIYESVGFQRCETNYALTWWQRNPREQSERG